MNTPQQLHEAIINLVEDATKKVCTNYTLIASTDSIENHQTWFYKVPPEQLSSITLGLLETAAIFERHIIEKAFSEGDTL